MAKSTGAFTDDVSTQITKQIMQLAVYANRHAHVNDVPAAKLCDILVEPHRRAFARDVAVTFAGNLTSDTFEVRVGMTPVDIDVGLPCPFKPTSTRAIDIGFNWSHCSPSFVVVPNQGKPVEVYRDTNPELVMRLEAMTNETMRNGVEYAFAARMWEWVNDWCATGDKAHARWLLPAVIPLLNRAGQDVLAGKLQGVRNPVDRKPVPLEVVPALQYVNQLIAGGLLYAQLERPTAQSELGWIDVTPHTGYTLDMYPFVTVQPITTISDVS